MKPTLFDLLDATHKTGITLTESFAMLPTAAVSGLYFGHPQSEYFGVARIGDDQVADYAARRDWIWTVHGNICGQISTNEGIRT